MVEDIERITFSCKICLESRRNTAKTPLTPWQRPSKPWSRIHTDFLGPFHGCMFLLIIDAHSKWPEIFNMKSNTQSDNLIKAFKNILVDMDYVIMLSVIMDHNTKAMNSINF